MNYTNEDSWRAGCGLIAVLTESTLRYGSSSGAAVCYDATGVEIGRYNRVHGRGSVNHPITESPEFARSKTQILATKRRGTQQTEESGRYTQHYQDAPVKSRTGSPPDRSHRRGYFDLNPTQQTAPQTSFARDPIAAVTDRAYDFVSKFRKKRVSEDDDVGEFPGDVSTTNPSPEQEPLTGEQFHIVMVTLTDPKQPSTPATERRIKVGGASEQEAVQRAIAFYTAKELKVGDASYVKRFGDQSPAPSVVDQSTQQPPESTGSQSTNFQIS